ncbi:glycogen operon protein [Lachnospiraceae bacterium YSD2013]|nr:glycogen operon protein [Lachnospiraceae bacterium YSD2013]
MQILLSKAGFKGYGVFFEGSKLYVCAALSHLHKAGIVLYNSENLQETKKITIPEDYFIGDVMCAYLTGSEFKNTAYTFFADDKTVIDPYARAVSEDGKFGLVVKEKAYPSFASDSVQFVKFEDSLLYTLNVRGYTMADKSVKSARGTFKGLIRKIDYIKKLGVTGVIFMPCYEVTDNDDSKTAADPAKLDYKKNSKVKKPNLWGFGKGYHFAVKKSLSSTDNAYGELQSMVKAFHDKGLECIFMMQYEEDASEDYIIDSLKYWLVNFHADGFRLVGPNVHAEKVLECPFFKNIKIITDGMNFGDYKPNTVMKARNLGALNYSFMNNARRFIKGDEDLVSYLSFAIRENAKFYSPIRNISDFWGFTLWDLVSYNIKHNELNDEANADGTDYNYSWNCGVEGDTVKRNINKLRLRQARNAMLLMMLAQGTPQILAGDEFLNTQKGNNNPYCQDNEIGWVTNRNDKASRDFTKFVMNLAAFRKRHSVLHQPKELMLFDYMSCKAPDVSFHGREAFKIDQSPVSREFAVLFFGDYSKQYTGKKEDSVYIIFNMHWEKKEFVLPMTDKTKRWRLLYSTDGLTDESFDESNAFLVESESYVAEGRSVSVLLLNS